MQSSTRRSFIGAAAGAAGGLAAGNARIAFATQPGRENRSLDIPDLDFLRHERLVHEPRARQLLREQGYDGYIATRGQNVLYLSNHLPLLSRMSDLGGAMAVFSATEGLPLGMVLGQFSYYYTYQEANLRLGHQHYLYTSPDPESDGPAAARMFRVIDHDDMDPIERRRRAAVAAAGPMHADARRALRAALTELVGNRARLATDDPELVETINSLSPHYDCSLDADILRAIRLVKSPAELELMSLASKQNIAAATEAAARLRDHWSLRHFRQDFYTEAARHGNTPVFMVIDGVAVDTFDAPIREGRGILIDCVSALHGYHGDYGRTVLIGEGSRRLESTVSAVRDAWDEVLEALKPGMSFSQIRQLGREALANRGHDLTVSFNPHSVGLHHTDQPRTARYRHAANNDITLLEDMILSVDCPVMDTGIGGTVHFEDLVHVSERGATPIHDSPDALIRV